jgi:class 3 adenylate cyclase
MKVFFQQTMNSGVQDGVICFKLLVLGVLVIAGLVVANAVFVFISQNLEEDYDNEVRSMKRGDQSVPQVFVHLAQVVFNFSKKFHTAAENVIEHSHERLSDMLKATRSFKNNLVSDFLDSDSVWPFVKATDFEARHQSFLQLSSATEVSLVCLVTEAKRLAWENFTVLNQDWVQEGLTFRGDSAHPSAIPPYIHLGSDYNGNIVQAPATLDPFYAVKWQTAPSPKDPVLVNVDMISSDTFESAFKWLVEKNEPVISKIFPDDVAGLYSYLLQPIHESFDEAQPKQVGVVAIRFSWVGLFNEILQPAAHGLFLVLENQCEQTFTFQINGPEALYIGEGDFHPLYETESLVESNFTQFNPSDSFCPYKLRLYASKEYIDTFESNDPLIFTAVVLMIFALAIFLFVFYDCCVERRHTRMTKTAQRNDRLISSLFPDQVKGQVMDQADKPKKKTTPDTKDFSSPGQGDGTLVPTNSSKPIAELFPNTTVLFADIVGFTAWSSVRQPSQVFMLLETLYNKFDVVARKLGVFKVETIGDCYVAVCGLPEPRKDHAVAITRFANSCLNHMVRIVQELEVSLGPDTGDLSMRFGLHSGPVIGGVLRGEKSRFQLYGDTVTVAALLEHTAEPGKIHLSLDTANELKRFGKHSWVQPRNRTILIEGKGEMETFWLSVGSAAAVAVAGFDDKKRMTHGRSSRKTPLISDSGGTETASVESPMHTLSENQADQGKNLRADKIAQLSKKKRRLVEWNVNMLKVSLKKILAMRGSNQANSAPSAEFSIEEEVEDTPVNSQFTVLQEVQEVIHLPMEAAACLQDPHTVVLPTNVVSQLTDYVATIASMYQENPFHSFEHASHVAMSATKLLARIVAPKDIDCSQQLHIETYGITSDPVTQFAIVFAALIHDVDHLGVPNAQLVHEGSLLAQMYHNKSVAEQHSVDLAWHLLMEPSYRDLRSCIYQTSEERIRFRHLVVNGVMATDIVDKELGGLRKQRWQKAFHPSLEDVVEQTDRNQDRDRKATIVIEVCESLFVNHHTAWEPHFD